jgi:hemoglobin/transferrin/lactoferrin receptor protein
MLRSYPAPRACLALAVLWGLASPLRGQEETDEQAFQDAAGRLGVVVITATRHARRLFDLPHYAEVSTREDLVRARTIQDALRSADGVHLQRTSYGQGSPFLRGLTGYHTVMLIDGIRLNNSVLRSGPNEYWGLVDGLSLDHLEIVLGPGSVLYGTDAVGGSINAIPLRRRKYGPESAWDRRLVLRVSTAEQSISGRTQVSGNVGEEFGYVIGVSAGAFSDLDAGGDVGRQPATSYQNGFGDARLDFLLSERWNLGVLAQASRVDDVDRVHRTVNGVSFHGTTTGSDLSRMFDWERDLAAVLVDGTDLDGIVDGVRLRLSYQRIQEDQDRTRGSGAANISGCETNTLGFGAEMTSETAIGRITWGVDYYHDEVDSFRRDYDATGALSAVRIQGPVGDDATYDLFGVFVQDEFPLSDDVDVILGGRFTYARADADKVEDPATGTRISLEDDWTAFVGAARAIWHASESVHLYTGVSQAFRAPNLSDLTRLDSARSGELEVPTLGLDPERFLDFEVGGKVVSDRLTAQAAWHYTLTRDLIIRQPTGATLGGESIVTKRNGGDGHIQGAELSAEYRLGEHWSVFGSLQWVDGQSETFPTSAPVSKTEALSRLAPLSGTLGVGWQTADRRFMVRAWALLVDRQDRLNTRDQADTSRIPPGGTPGYGILNLDATFSVSDSTHAFLSVENILDKNYRTHGSGVQEPGFNVVLGVDVTF